MTWIRPSPAVIADRCSAEVNASLPGADARLRWSAEGVLVRCLAMTAHELHGHLAWLALQMLPDTAEAEHLERHAGIWGIDRLAAAAAVGGITIAGTIGAVLPAGAELQRSDGILYVTAADATVGADGTVVVPATASVAGAAGNCAAGVGVALTSAVAGIHSQATVADDGSGSGMAAGADIEGDDSLRARVLARIQQPPHGGAMHDYLAWALAVPGVGRAWVRPQHMGPGTVGVYVAGDDPGDPVPAPALVEAVQVAIDAARPVTAEVWGVGVVAMPVAMTIVAVPDTVAVRAAIVAELQDFLAREGEPGGTIWLSRLRAAVSAAGGEYRHQLVVPAADIAVPAGEVPVLGTVTWA